MKIVQEKPLAVKRVRIKIVSCSGPKRGRPPYVQFETRGKRWRVYFRQPLNTVDVPKQLFVKSAGEQHHLYLRSGDDRISFEVVGQLVISSDPLAFLKY